MRGLAWLRTRYRLRLSSSILSREGYLAGDDPRRAAELARALSDPETRAVVCARGGYGIMRILDTLPWGALDRAPKWVVGFSDVTALHVAAAARGIATVHGPNVTGLERHVSPAERASVIAALEASGEEALWRELERVHAGVAAAATTVRGPLFGGNLTMVCAMAAAGRLEVPAGAVVALEDVTERPYRIDRMLTTLLLGGHLARASAVVFGSFTHCEPGPDGITWAQVIAERTKGLGVPVVANAPFGHGAPNLAFVLGREVELRGDALAFLPAVASRVSGR